LVSRILEVRHLLDLTQSVRLHLQTRKRFCALAHRADQNEIESVVDVLPF
jgi:hypothetical protein